ncbi:hypothetical protein [Sunxiuqinia sp. sy24]|uniref:hypothetical protein n=1 Tax=Sunxiuqinia sp. sy24 TaxID=3461495 RepID=UPI0040464B29
MRSFVLLLVLLGCSLACKRSDHKLDAIRSDEDNGGLTLLDGFLALVVADTLG